MSNKAARAFTYYGADEIGQRTNQEDYFSFSEEANGALLLVLADGMGGHSAGEVASRIAVESFIKSFRDLSTSSLPGKLSISLERANGEIKRVALEDPSKAGMGCTIVAAYIAAQGLSWASVGDSMLMLVRGGMIRRLNADHSMVPLIEASQKEGKITAEDAANHPQRNVLRSALTGDRLELVDISNDSLALRAGDCLISASDGLATLSDVEICSLAAKYFSSGPEEITRTLLRAVKAKNMPRQDNTTVQVICILKNIGTAPKRKQNKWIYSLAVGFALIASILGWKLFLEVPGIRGFVEREGDRPQSSLPVPVAVPVQTSPTSPEQRPTEPRPRASGEIEKGKPPPKTGGDARPQGSTNRNGPEKDNRVELPQRRTEKGGRNEESSDTYKSNNPSPAISTTPVQKDGSSQGVQPDESSTARDPKPAGSPAPVIDRSVRDARSDDAGKPKGQTSVPQPEASP
jgi:serine/threonine protein phosphatase PrpC